MSDLDNFLQDVQVIADEFLGYDRYEVYRLSRDKAQAAIAAQQQQIDALRAALADLMWRFDEDDSDPFEKDVSPDIAAARRALLAVTPQEQP